MSFESLLLFTFYFTSSFLVVQADVCHAYHVVRRNGIPASNVILMSYGDAAYSEENPFPGKLFNRPTQDGVAGYDVNEGCVAKYSGEDVTASNFLAVLRGDNKTTGPFTCSELSV